MINFVLLSKKLLSVTSKKGNMHYAQLRRITENLPHFWKISEKRQAMFLENMTLAVLKLPIGESTMAINILWELRQYAWSNYSHIAKEHLVASKGDCEKIAIIDAITYVQEVDRIPKLLDQSRDAENNHKMQENAIRKVLYFLQSTSALTHPNATPELRTDIVKIAKEIRNRQGNCRERAKEYLSTITTILTNEKESHEIQSESNL